MGEHTWGWAGGDTQKAPWNNAGLQTQLRTDPSYAQAIASWEEQRSFLRNAVAALGGGRLATDIQTEWNELAPVPFDSDGFIAIANSSAEHQCGPDVTIGFDPSTGGVSVLRLRKDGRSWATPSHQILRPWYQNVDAAYIKQFDLAYGGPRMGGNFGKPGLNLSALNSSARVLTLWQRTGDSNTSFLLRMAMDDAAHAERGAPAALDALLVVPHAPPFAIEVSAQSSSSSPPSLRPACLPLRCRSCDWCQRRCCKKKRATEKCWCWLFVLAGWCWLRNSGAGAGWLWLLVHTKPRWCWLLPVSCHSTRCSGSTRRRATPRRRSGC